MEEFDTPIANVDRAQAFFRAMGCSSFNMGRDWPQRYEEYKAFAIPKSTEDSWRAEELERALEVLADGSHERELWSRHSTMWDLHGGLDSRELRQSFFTKALDATYDLFERATQFDRVLIAETILGRAMYRNDGMVHEAHVLRRREDRDELFRYVSQLLDFEAAEADLNQRRLKALELSHELQSAPKMFPMPAWFERIVGR